MAITDEPLTYACHIWHHSYKLKTQIVYEYSFVMKITDLARQLFRLYLTNFRNQKFTLKGNFAQRLQTVLIATVERCTYSNAMFVILYKSSLYI
jgi:hypothetical protein